MAIRFFCQRCSQLLSIASRKAGAEIECPKCGIPQTVPTEEAAAAALAMNDSSSISEANLALKDFAVYDEDPVPVAVERPLPRKADSNTVPRRSTTTEAGNPLVATLEEVPHGMILFNRRTIYVQGVLFVVVATIAFTAGYFIGRGDASIDLIMEEEATQSVWLEGRLVYDPGDGTRVGDEGAVVIAVPATDVPQTPLSGQGIRPIDPELADTRETVREIEEFGGAYARADASGAFALVLPRQGGYRLLLISRHATRSAEGQIDELDLQEMEEYFLQPEGLVGQFKYRWFTREVNAGAERLEHDFGQRGRDQPIP
jgi:hypothetical protein